MRGTDEQDFAELVARSSHRLRRTAYLLCGDWHEAEDLVQTTFIKLYCAWHKVDRRGDLDAYLRKSLLHACIDEKRRGWWRRERPTAAPPELPADSGDPVHDRDLLVSGLRRIAAVALWADPGTSAADAATRRTGTLSLAVDSAQKPPAAQEPCMTTATIPSGLISVIHLGGAWKEVAALGPCTKSTLPDGSTLWSSSTSEDSLTVVSVTRYFADNGGMMAAAWRNFPLPTTSPNWVSRAVNPNPITVEQLKAAMSDPTLVPPLPPHPSPH